MPDPLMPALFIGHGSPMNAIEDTPFQNELRSLGQSIAKPRAIVCISAHWESEEFSVTAGSQPATIHDFYGFPPELFAVRYPAPGDPQLAARIADLLTPDPVILDRDRGFEVRMYS